MDTGILMFVTPQALAVTDLARACEERRIESLWVPEHPVVPVRYRLDPGPAAVRGRRTRDRGRSALTRRARPHEQARGARPPRSEAETPVPRPTDRGTEERSWLTGL